MLSKNQKQLGTQILATLWGRLSLTIQQYKPRNISENKDGKKLRAVLGLNYQPVRDIKNRNREFTNLRI